MYTVTINGLLPGEVIPGFFQRDAPYESPTHTGKDPNRPTNLNVRPERDCITPDELQAKVYVSGTNVAQRAA